MTKEISLRHKPRQGPPLVACSVLLRLSLHSALSFLDNHSFPNIPMSLHQEHNQKWLRFSSLGLGTQTISESSDSLPGIGAGLP